MNVKDQDLYRIRTFNSQDIIANRYSYSFGYVVFLNGKEIGFGRTPNEAVYEILYDYLNGSTVGYEDVFKAAVRKLTHVVGQEDVERLRSNSLLDCSLCGIIIGEYLEVERYLDGLTRSEAI